jgi:hypothetical protein
MSLGVFHHTTLGEVVQHELPLEAMVLYTLFALQCHLLAVVASK